MTGIPNRSAFLRRLTNRCSCRAARCAAEAVSGLQCLLFVRTGVAGPQLSSTVRCPVRALSAFARWMGVVALAAVLSWSVASRWYSLDWISDPTDGQQFVVGSGYGILYLKSIHTPAWIGGDARLHRPTGFSRRPPSYRWWFRFVQSGPPLVTGIEIPLWSAALALAMLCAPLWSSRLRRSPGTCPRCGYPIGHSRTCSECGGPVSPDAQRRGT